MWTLVAGARSNFSGSFPLVMAGLRSWQGKEQSRATIDLAGISLDVWEGGDGPPLLFLHGAGGFRADHPFVAKLARYRRITAPSHPGFGVSSLPNWIDRPEDIAHVYLDLLDR